VRDAAKHSWWLLNFLPPLALCEVAKLVDLTRVRVARIGSAPGWPSYKYKHYARLFCIRTT
jgi:hypothetical protein